MQVLVFSEGKQVSQSQDQEGRTSGSLLHRGLQQRCLILEHGMAMQGKA